MKSSSSTIAALLAAVAPAFAQSPPRLTLAERAQQILARAPGSEGQFVVEPGGILRHSDSGLGCKPFQSYVDLQRVITETGPQINAPGQAVISRA